MINAFITYFTTWTAGAVGQVHLISALMALITGFFVLGARKGTFRHVIIGYVYLLSMLIVNGSALMKYDLTGAPNLFHYAAMGSLITIMGGYISAVVFRRTKRIGAAAAHGIFMIWSYFGLFIALIAEIVTRQYPAMLHGEGGWTRFTLALAVLMAVTGAMTHVYAQREIARTLKKD